MLSDKVESVPVRVVELGTDVVENELVEDAVDANVVGTVDVRTADVVVGGFVEVLARGVVVGAVIVVVTKSGQSFGNCAFKSII